MHYNKYDVAVSLDGFVSGPAGDVSLFADKGPVVDDYVARLGGYAMALMGRSTYEFGYAFGLRPGQNPYPQMETIVFSGTLEIPEDSEVGVCRSATVEDVLEMKRRSAGPVYLCGGGALAGWLLQRGLIDRVILKRAPVIYGDGVRLFGGVGHACRLRRVFTRTYDDGYVLEEFDAQTGG